VRLLFVIDPPESLAAYKDTTVTIMRAAQARGHKVHACTTGQLWYDAGAVRAAAMRLALTVDDADWYRAEPPRESLLADFDAVLMRKDPPFDLEYVTATWLLSVAEREGARVFNRPAAVRDQNEKLGILEFPQFTAPTLVAREPERLQRFIDEQGDVILKRLDSMGGESIFRVRGPDPNRNAILEVMAQGGARSVMAQRYLPEIRDGDRRVLLIDGRAVPYALARHAQEGETRANLAAGGRGVAQPLTPREREIAEALGPVLAPRGLLLVGLDVIGGFLTEVNVTSPTCFREIQDQTGFDVAGMFVEALQARLGARA
jgi:glutathione synthase